MAAQPRAQALPVEDVVAEDERGGLRADVLLTDDERLRETVRRRLLRVGERDAELRAVAEQALELLGVVRSRDDEDVADAREHQRRQRVVDHRLVVHRDELLGDAEGDRVQTRAGSPGKNDAAHLSSLDHASAGWTKPPNRAHGNLEAMTRLLVTGGAGFIGSDFVHYVLAHTDDR